MHEEYIAKIEEFLADKISARELLQWDAAHFPAAVALHDAGDKRAVALSEIIGGAMDDLNEGLFTLPDTKAFLKKAVSRVRAMSPT